MRPFKVFSPLSLLFGARASFLDSRSPAPHPLDARQLPDVCEPINTQDINLGPNGNEIATSLKLYGGSESN